MARKILFLSASIGSGHSKAAQAVIDALSEMDFHMEIRHIDVLSFMPDFFYKLPLRLYLWSLRHCPFVYAWLYKRSDTANGKVRGLLHDWLADRLRAVLGDFIPQCVVCTHILGGGIMDSWNRRFGALPYICCVTDFVVHTAWCYRSAAAYIVDNEQQIKKLVQQGIAAERCFCWGIPFTCPPLFKRADSRRQLGIYEKERLIFIYGGGCGILPLDVRCLLPLAGNVRLTVCCGMNRALYEKLRYVLAPYKKCLVLGYIDNVSQWLAASDLVITKAGGLSLCEILAQQKRCIVCRPLGGQEAGNAAYCHSQGWLEIARNEAECKKIIDKMFRFESNGNRKETAVRSPRTNAAEKIADMILNKLYK